jgi:hypothetical protein
MLLGPSEFVERMKKLLEGDHREQTGIRKAKEGNLNWETITSAMKRGMGPRLGGSASWLWHWSSCRGAVLRS